MVWQEEGGIGTRRREGGWCNPSNTNVDAFCSANVDGCCFKYPIFDFYVEVGSGGLEGLTAPG